MNGFFWTSGHLGWGIFALACFSSLWWLLSDLVWRLRNTSFRELLAVMSGGWILGVLLILLGFFIATP